MADAMAGRPISAVLRDIIRDVQEIVHSEIRLAKTEVSEELVKAKGAGFLLGLGAFFGFFATLFGLVAAVYGLSRVMPNWAAALLVAAPLGVAAVGMCMAGLKRFREVHPIPDHAVENVKENVQWAIQQFK